jgi:hypothetical protein
MLTPLAPSTSNINDRLQYRRHLKAEEVMRLIADIYRCRHSLLVAI